MAVRHGVTDTDKHFLIDPVARAIINESGKLVLIQYDHNSERFTFECPRYVDNHDMSLCNRVEIHFINTGLGDYRNSGVYEIRDLQVPADNNKIVTCSWLISQQATQHVGKLHFVIRFACIAEDGVVEYAWNTGIYSDILVSKSIYNGEEFVQDYVDILELWKQDLYTNGLRIASVEQTVTSTEDDGINVVTMTMVDDSVETFQIKNGSKGSPGIDVTHEWDGTTLKVTSASGTSSTDLKGEKGDPGIDVTHEWDGTTLKVTSASGTSSSNLKGEKGDPGVSVTHEWNGTTLKVTSASGTSSADLKGEKGDTGDAFTYDMFTPEQLAGLKGEKGDAFTYEMFTPEQIKSITGPQGDPGVSVTHEWDGTTLKVTSASGTSSADLKGEKGEKGETGDAFTYNMFTPDQLAALKGETGDPGVSVTHEWDGTTLKVTSASGTTSTELKGEKGETGDAFTYDMFTSDQLAALKGEKGDAGTHIVSIERTAGTGAAGSIDTYTLTTNDGSVFTFNVYNGADGEGAGDMVKAIYDPQNKNTDIFAYVDNRIGAIDELLDSINGE